MEYDILKGCGTALVTPFKGGEVDYDAYARLVRRQVDAGIHFLVPLGSTAETPCLDDQEKVDVLKATRDNAPGKKLLAGVGTNSLRQTVKNMQLLDEADMYLVVVPYYNKPTQQGLYEYFKAVANSTDKPIVLYNVPSRTGTNMTAATTIRLSELPNVIAIKEASGNLDQINDIIKAAPEGFTVLSGNDDQTLDIMRMGGHGVISVASNIAPAMMTQMVEKALDYDYNGAKNIFRQLVPLFDACFVESNPIPVKGGLAYMQLISNELRLPLTPCVASTYHLMADVINELKI